MVSFDLFEECEKNLMSYPPFIDGFLFLHSISGSYEYNTELFDIYGERELEGKNMKGKI